MPKDDPSQEPAKLVQHKDIFQQIQKSVTSGYESLFPIIGRNRELRAHKIWVEDDKDPHDYKGQESTKLNGGTWGVPVYGDFELVDKGTGQTVDRKERVKFATLPKLTPRYSFIVKGSEYQVSHQMRRKPGAYTRIGTDGNIEAMFNSSIGSNFKMLLDKDSGKLHLNVGSSNTRLYPILKHLGVSEQEMVDHFGPEVVEVNRRAVGHPDNEIRDVLKLYKNLHFNKEPESFEHAVEGLKTYFHGNTAFDPDVTHINFGEAHTNANPKLLLLVGKKLLNISRGTEEPDDQESVIYKTLHGVDDFLRERIGLRSERQRLHKKVMNTLDRRDSISDIINHQIFTHPVESLFTQTELANLEDQTNPLSMLGRAHQVTIHGPGGISDEHQVSTEARGVHPSHLGFLDVLQTPESHQVGAVMRLPLGSVKDGNVWKTELVNHSTGQREHLTAKQAHDHTVAFADDFYPNKDGSVRPVAANGLVRALRQGKFVEVRPDEVDYRIPTPRSMYGLSSNMSPFLSSNSGKRGIMMAKMAEQALPLVNREVPLVQVVAGPGGQTYEALVGQGFTTRAPTNGTVIHVGDGEIHIQSGGKVHKVQYYDNFPLNAKHFFHSEPTVKPGDVVQKDQLLAELSHTRDGVLSLGVNARVGYLNYKGVNIEDGHVVREGFAREQLKSSHLHKESFLAGDKTLLDVKKFRAHHPLHLTEEQARKLDDRGIVRIGETVHPGDTVIAGMTPNVPKVEDQVLKNLHRSLVKPWSNAAVTWDHHTSGKVVKIGRHGKRIDVYVRTEEPLVEADKIVGRFANKGVVVKLIPDHEMPHTADGRPLDVLFNPHGLPSRLNTGQIHETLAGKIAEKTGKPFLVENFKAGLDYKKWIDDELTKHGLSDTEEVFDPTDGSSLGQILTGRQYIMKLDHSVSKKFNTRDRAGYTMDRTPVRGSDEGAQAIDPLTLYGMLSHNARTLMWEQAALKCLVGHMKVCTDQGDLTISRIVRGRLPVKVLSMQKDGTFAWRRVVDYFRYRTDHATRRVEVTSSELLDLGYSTGYNEDRHLVCTPEHKILTPVGKVRSADLFVGDLVLVKATTPSPTQEAVLVGTLLGDSSLRPRSPLSYISICHGEDQIQYLCWKMSLLSGLFGEKAIGVSKPVGYGVKNGKLVFHARSMSLPWFAELEEQLYSSDSQDIKWLPKHRKRRKVITKAFLDRLDLRSLAFFYMDDGCSSYKRSTLRGKTKRWYTNDKLADGYVEVRFCVGEITLKEIDLLRKRMGEIIGITPSAPKFINGVRLAYIGYRGAAALEFLFAVAPYIHPSMSYKMKAATPKVQEALLLLVGSKMKELESKAEVRACQVRLTSIKPTTIGKRTRDAKFVYDLEVEETHNYVSQGLIVSNSERNDDIWRAIQTGSPLPPPKPTFVWDKFMALLQGMGLDVKREGSRLKLLPTTDQQVLSRSKGAIRLPFTLRAKDLAPMEGGLLDPELTGGIGGSSFNHIELHQPFPNPVFEKPIKAILGLTGPQFDSLLAGTSSVVDGQLVPHAGGKVAGEGLQELLARIDPKLHLDQTLAQAKTARANDLDRLNRKARYLKALVDNDIRPEAAYLNSVIPVVPPKFRPIHPMADGSLYTADLNYIYKNLMIGAEQLGEGKDILPQKHLAPLRQEIYHHLKGLAGLEPLASAQDGREYHGILTDIRGKGAPKEGIFQSKLIGRRQDLSARSTIISGPELGPHEVGLPREMLKTLFRPFIIRRLFGMGVPPLRAQEMIDQEDPVAVKALEQEAKERPVILGRAPNLHKFSELAFYPVPVDGLAIKVHPLVLPGMGADFDGDSASIHVPVTPAGVAESKRLLATHSDNLRNPGTGKLMILPMREHVLGLYRLTLPGEKTNLSFSNFGEAREALKKKQIHYNDVVNIGGQKTSVGRALVNALLPEEHRDHNRVFDSRGIREVASKIANTHPHDFGRIMNDLKDLGANHAYKSGATITFKDLEPFRKERDQILDVAKKKVRLAKFDDRLSEDQKEQATIEAYTEASKQIDRMLQEKVPASNSLAEMVRSGSIGSWQQLRQVLAAPVLMEGMGGKPIPIPVTKSYAEGLSSAEYFIQSFGARKGAVDKSKQTSVPGYFAKQLVNSMINLVAEDHPSEDEGPVPGIKLGIDDPDIHDRYLAQDVRDVASAGELITPDLLRRARNSGHQELEVRSPLTSLAAHGIYPKDYGLLPGGKPISAGDNVGVMVAQAMSEPATQMSFKLAHGGGAVGAQTLSGFRRIEQLFNINENLPGRGVLSEVPGVVESITPAPTGGHVVVISGVPHRVSSGLNLSVKPGDTVEVGQALSDGITHPRDLLRLKGLRPAQDYLVNEILKAYHEQGFKLKRVIVEAAVRSMTNLTHITDPGEDPDYVPGDYAPISMVEHKNRNGGTIRHTPVLKGIHSLPLYRDEWVSNLNFENLKETILEAAAKGRSEDIHGYNPLVAYAHGSEFGRVPKHAKKGVY